MSEIVVTPGYPPEGGITPGEDGNSHWWDYAEGGGCQYPSVLQEVVTYDVVCHDAAPAVAGAPSEPAVDSQIVEYLHAGWNSYAVSTDTIPPGHAVEFSVGTGSMGVFVGIGEDSKAGKEFAYFTHGILVDLDGIHVMESGQKVTSLTNNYLEQYKINIQILPDDSVNYFVMDGTTVLANYQSKNSIQSTLDLYVHGDLYLGGDRLLNAEIYAVTEQVFYAAADFAGSGFFMSTDQTDMAMFGGTGTFEADASNTDGFGQGIEELPDMFEVGSYDLTLGEVVEELPEMLSDGVGETPRASVIGLENLMLFADAGTGTDVDVAYSIWETLPEIIDNGSEEEAMGEVYEDLPPLGAYANEEPRLQMSVMADFYADSFMSLLSNQTMIILSHGQIADTISMTRTQVMALLSKLETSTSISFIGSFSMELLTELFTKTSLTMSIDGQPDLDDSGQVWVVNLDTGASSQYEGFGFNSFFERDGVSYGVASDGVYRLDSDTDQGHDIEALIDFGRSNYQIPQVKRCPYVYLGVGSEGKLYLKVDADEQTYIYEARSSSTAVKNNRVDIGKGLLGNYWRFVLLNNNGDDFDLDSIQFELLPQSREIY